MFIPAAAAAVRLNVGEFLISPYLIQRYPLDNLPDSNLFDIHHVARSMLLHKKVVLSYDLPSDLPTAAGSSSTLSESQYTHVHKL